MRIKSLILIVCACLIHSINAQSSCSNVGNLGVFLDPTCSTTGGAGCNAGGQGQNCRFCGFDIFPPCPSATTAGTTGPTTTKETTTTTKNTATTTPRTTVSGATSGTGGNGGNGGGWGPTNPPPPGTLIFDEEFDKFDLKVWKHDLTMSGGGNWEFQLYHNNRTNSYVKDGRLVIKPTLTEDRIGIADLKANYRMDMWGGSPVDQCTGNNFYGCERMAGAGGNILNPIQSAKITTVESFSVKYGKVEVRAKLPEGDWLWPAIWLLPRRNQYGMWPASGEIDIMESRGNKNYPTSAGGGYASFGSTLHWGCDWTQNRFELTHAEYHHGSSLADEFHNYGLVWTEDRLYTYFDDESNIILDVDLKEQSFYDRGKFASVYENPWKDQDVNAPFNQEFYIIINLAVGGTAGYFPDGVAGKPWNDKSSNSVNQFYEAKNSWYPTWKNNPTFEIDYVKVWSV